MNSVFSFFTHNSWIMLFVATAGGACVTFGLILEFTGEKEYFANLRDYFDGRRKRKLGEFLVLAGVFVETLDAGFIAMKDNWEKTQEAKEISQNAPLNQPIANVSAVVRFKIDANFNELPRYGGPAVAEILPATPPGTNVIIGRQHLRRWYVLPISEFPILETEHAETLPEPNGGVIYIMNFHWDELIRGLGAGRSREIPIKEIERINVLSIMVKYLPHNIEISEGTAQLVVNDSVVKTFTIPRQKNNRVDDSIVDTYSNTTPFVILAFPTNRDVRPVGHWR